MASNQPRVWLITGASSGFGRAIAEAALAAGDTVVAEVLDRHGRVDVLVNNAGRGAIGAAEETSDGELRGLMDLHFFGPVALTRAVLPGMRERGTGAIVQM